MKNLKTPIALAILLAAAPAVNAADLTISGEVVDSTCTAAITGGLAVTMSKIDLADLKRSARVGRKALDVVVTCDGASSSQDVAVQFTGPSTADGALALTASSGAKGVAYKIFDNTDTLLPINGIPTQYVTVADGAPQTLNHSVWYAASLPEDEMVAGSAVANAQMDIIYK